MLKYAVICDSVGALRRGKTQKEGNMIVFYPIIGCKKPKKVRIARKKLYKNYLTLIRKYMSDDYGKIEVFLWQLD